MGQSSTEALLFDLGGVVFPIDFERALARWATHAGVPAESLRPFYRIDSWYERHERGEIGAEAYFDALRDTLGLSLTDAELVEGWNAIFEQEFSGAFELFRRLGERIPIYAFSNTNVTHQRFWERKYARTLRLFRRVFVSCELGARKPEAEAFERVTSAMGIDPGAVRFFDDTRENVEGARAFGMTAVLVRDFDDVRANVGEFLE